METTETSFNYSVCVGVKLFEFSINMGIYSFRFHFLYDEFIASEKAKASL